MRTLKRPMAALHAVLVAILAGACGGGFVGSCGLPHGPSPQAAPLPEAAPVQPDERPKVVVLGDSISAGLGLVETQSFPGLLQQKADAEGLDFEIVNAGVSGDTSAGGLRRLDWFLKEDVRVLVLELGANDGLRGLSVAEMKQNLGQIVETAQNQGVVVILAGMEAPPNYGPEYAAAFRQSFAELAREYRTPFIPFLLDKVGGIPSLNQADGIHPNAQGARIVADTVWNVLRPILEQVQNQSS